jgi:hypothetical protein
LNPPLPQGDFFFKVHMTDREKWVRGVAAVRNEYAALPYALRVQLAECIALIKLRKKTLQALVDEVRAGEICAACGGECCARGKNHFTVVDLLAYLADDRQLFTPRFGREICPYLGEFCCLMPPEYRPYNCITFVCERVEGLLAPREQALFYAVERELRELYERLERLLDNRFRAGLLMNCERDLVQGRTAILRGAALAKEPRYCTDKQ